MINSSWIKIIEAAYPLFMKKGYKKTTTAEIAEIAGINESTLFRNFGSKDFLFQSSIDYFAKKAIKGDFNILEYTGDIHQDLKQMIRAMYNLLFELIPSYRLLIKQSLVDSKILFSIKNDLHKQENLFSHYVNGMKSRNMIKDIDSEVLVDLIFSKVFISTFDLLSHGNKENLEDIIEDMTLYFIRLIKK